MGIYKVFDSPTQELERDHNKRYFKGKELVWTTKALRDLQEAVHWRPDVQPEGPQQAVLPHALSHLDIRALTEMCAVEEATRASVDKVKIIGGPHSHTTDANGNVVPDKLHITLAHSAEVHAVHIYVNVHLHAKAIESYWRTASRNDKGTAIPCSVPMTINEENWPSLDKAAGGNDTRLLANRSKIVRALSVDRLWPTPRNIKGNDWAALSHAAGQDHTGWIALLQARWVVLRQGGQIVFRRASQGASFVGH